MQGAGSEGDSVSRPAGPASVKGKNTFGLIEMRKGANVEMTRLAKTGATPPPAPRHEVVDLELRQRARRIEADYMAFIELAQEAIAGQYHLKFGFQTEEAYFSDRVGISYRSVRRRLQILEGVLRLPPAEQTEARAALAEIGAHKAAEVARILGRDGGAPWRDLVEFAKGVTEEALREEVSIRLGTKPRGLPAGQPGDAFLRYVLNQIPPEVLDHVEQTFAGLMRRFELSSAVSAFLVLVDLGAAELAAWERPVEEGS